MDVSPCYDCVLTAEISMAPERFGSCSTHQQSSKSSELLRALGASLYEALITSKSTSLPVQRKAVGQTAGAHSASIGGCPNRPNSPRRNGQIIGNCTRSGILRKEAMLQAWGHVT